MVLPLCCFFVIGGMIVIAERYYSGLDANGLEVEIFPEEVDFVREEAINQKLQEAGNAQLAGFHLGNVDKKSIEKAINNHSYVEDVRAYSLLTGEVRVEVRQKIPFFRVINKEGESFYVDRKGSKIPEAGHYSYHCLVVRGDIDEPSAEADTFATEVMEETYKAVRAIEEDPFVKRLTGELNYFEERGMKIIPRIGDAKIILGDVRNLQGKFQKLTHFYQQTLPEKGWNTYSTINLQFENQIIAKR